MVKRGSGWLRRPIIHSAVRRRMESRRPVPPPRGPSTRLFPCSSGALSCARLAEPAFVSPRGVALGRGLCPVWSGHRGAAAAGAGGGAGRLHANSCPMYQESLASLSEGYLLAGRPDEAMQARPTCPEACSPAQGTGHPAWVLRLLGEIAAPGDPEVEPAEEHYRQALALADELGMRPLQAHCHFGLGTLYAQDRRRAGPRRTVRRHRALPRHGDDLLAAPGGGGAGANRRMRTPGKGVRWVGRPMSRRIGRAG